jgi:signal transduction histidine kinase
MRHEFEKEQKLQEAEQERKDMEKEAELKRQRILVYTFSGAFVFILLLVIVIYRSYRVKRKANELLARQKQEIKVQRDKLHELNVTKDKFFSIIAHDLKNPFSALIGFSKIMITEFENFEKKQIKEFVQSVYKSSENTYNLLENLLEWAKTQTGKIQWKPMTFELSEVTDSAIELLNRNAFNKNIRLQNEIKKETPVVADKNMLHTVIRNLISNAIKFTNKGGDVIISAKKIISPGNITEVELKVEDTGIGISDANMRRIQKGETFSTLGTDREYGTGLGIVLVKEFIEKNGGRLKIESELNKGTRFICYFPYE